MSNRIEEIKDRLARTTDGPWETFPSGDAGTGLSFGGESFIACWATSIGGGPYRHEENALFIANSPSDIQFLLDEVEKLTKEKEQAYDEGFGDGSEDANYAAQGNE